MAHDSLRIHTVASLNPGPRLLVLGGVHGDETCGSAGIERVLAELDSGALQLVRGQLTLVPVANPLARARLAREGERNLNRSFRPAQLPADNEDRITNVLCPLLEAHEVLLDLHSFQSAGEPFAMIGPRNNSGTLEGQFDIWLVEDTAGINTPYSDKGVLMQNQPNPFSANTNIYFNVFNYSDVQLFITDSREKR